jgi:hypothetical protein
MTISTPAAVGKAVSSGVTDVAYRCRRGLSRTRSKPRFSTSREDNDRNGYTAS